MADATVNATVSIERIAHDCLRELAERMYSDHGLMLTEVRFDWRTAHIVGQDAEQVYGLGSLVVESKTV
jgi:hypothetical protein